MTDEFDDLSAGEAIAAIRRGLAAAADDGEQDPAPDRRDAALWRALEYLAQRIDEAPFENGGTSRW